MIKYSLFVLFFLLTFAACKPSYSIVHKGNGVFSDSVTFRYRSGNLIPYGD